MRIPQRKRSRGIAFNITPLIDVVFNLVIFFLVASHFARSEPLENVTLPYATQTFDDDRPRQLTVTVQMDGTYSVAGNVVSISEIEQMVQEGAGENPANYAVRIRGDRFARYEFIEPILLSCVRNGIVDFGFNVTPSSD